MGLIDIIKEHGAPVQKLNICIIKGGSLVKSRNMGTFFDKDRLLYFMSRTTLTSIMFERVQPLTSSGMDIRLSTRVTHVHFEKDADGSVEMESSTGEISKFNARFMLACDGVHSVVRRSLGEEDVNSALESRHRFGLLKLYSESVGLRFKSVHRLRR